jgi:hypothetical protein
MKLLRDALRQTGRTSRMIDEAICAAKTGKLVYIICDNIDQRKAVEKQIEKFIRSNTLRVRVCEPQHVGEINWETLTITGQSNNTIVFIDHLVIENRLHTALEMLNRWNSPNIIESVTPNKCSNMDNYKDWEIDTPVWCNCNSGNGGWYHRYFAGVDCDGRPYAWNDGEKSFTTTRKTEWDVMKKASSFSPAFSERPTEERKKCIVHGCENHSDQGQFIGDLCMPCHMMITTGKIGLGKTFIHEMNSAMMKINELSKA